MRSVCIEMHFASPGMHCAHIMPRDNVAKILLYRNNNHINDNNVIL